MPIYLSNNFDEKFDDQLKVKVWSVKGSCLPLTIKI